MAPLQGWEPRGERLKAPYGHWTMTFIAALLPGRRVVDRPDNQRRPPFQLYVAKVLPPSLRDDDVAVANDLASHGSKVARRAISLVGARLIFLPKYSPDLKPCSFLPRLRKVC